MGDARLSKGHRGRRLTAALGWLWLALTPLAWAQAGDAQNLVFILDGSGSMWGRIEGEPKIAVAKEVMQGVVDQLPSETQTGLIAYGHRVKGDCHDVEILAQLAPLDRTALKDTIRGISPKGKTPITRSINKALEPLRAREAPASVVLVSDGIETCGGDPCQAVREARQAGIDFRLHAVGFDVGRAATEQLQCMADAGGGRLFTAESAGELTSALEQAAAVAPELAVTTTRNGEPTDARVRVLQDGAAVADVHAGGEGQQAIALEPGTYTVTAVDEGLARTQPQRREGLEVSEQGGEVSFDFQAAGLSIAVMAQGQPVKAGLRVVEAGTDQLVTEGWATASEERNPRVFDLPPGSYDVMVEPARIEGADRRRLTGIQVKPGQAVSRTVRFGKGELAVTVKANGELTKAGLRVVKAGSDQFVTDGWAVARAEGNPKVFTLPPGHYDVIVEPAWIEGAQPGRIEGLEVAPGERLKRTVRFDEGELAVTVKANGELTKAGLRVVTAKKDRFVTDGWVVARADGNPKVFILPPGQYDVIVEPAWIEGAQPRRIEGLDVAVGQRAQRTVRFDQGKLALSVRANGELAKAGIRIVEAGTNQFVTDGWAVARAEGNPKVFTVPPGHYDAILEPARIRGVAARRVKDIAIARGERVQRSVDFEAGRLALGATADGEPAKAGVGVLEAGTDRLVTDGWIQPNDRHNPWVLRIKPGEYDIVFEPAGIPDAEPQRVEGVTVSAGKRTAKSVSF